MTTIKTYVDANILIVASRVRPSSGERVLAILDDTRRNFIVSDYLVLETIPKPSFHGKQDQVKFMKDFIASASRHVESSSKIVAEAISLACRYDLQPLDALHVSAAIFAKADEFLTLERPTSPLCRIKEIDVISLYESAA